MINTFSKYKKYFIGGAFSILTFAVGCNFEKIYIVKNEPQNVTLQNPLTKLEVDPTWVLEGKPEFSATQFYSTPDKSVRGGIFECVGPTKFVWKYQVEESVYILEGEVKITYLGKSYHLKAGDQFHFYPNTEANWVVDSRVKKSWVMRDRSSMRDRLSKIIN